MNVHDKEHVTPNPNSDVRSYPSEKDPEQIEQEIEETRAEMSHTLDAIQRKLSPGQLMDQVLGYFRSEFGNVPGEVGSTFGEVRSTVGEFGSNLGRTVRENPMPVVLVGAGLAWLMMSSSSRQPASPRRPYSSEEWYTTPSSRSPSMGERLGEAESKVGAATGRAGDRVSGAASSATHKASEVASSATHKAGEVASSASHRLGEMSDAARDQMGRAVQGARARAGETASQVRYQAERLGDMAYHQTERVRSEFSHLLQEQPLVLGALGIALGAALGASLPMTRREDEVMGETRDELMQRAKEGGREQLHKAQRVAEAALNTAREEAEKEGLSRETGQEQLQRAEDKVRNVAEAAWDSAKEEADRQGLNPPQGATNQGTTTSQESGKDPYRGSSTGRDPYSR